MAADRINDLGAPADNHIAGPEITAEVCLASHFTPTKRPIGCPCRHQIHLMAEGSERPPNLSSPGPGLQADAGVPGKLGRPANSLVRRA